MKRKNQVLFIHGFLENHSIWDSIISGLAKDYSCIAPDLPGCTPVSMPIRSLKDEAIALREIIAENCFVIGHSMGGYVALELCAMFPEKVRGLCLFHSTAMEDSQEKRKDRLRAMSAATENKSLYVRTVLHSLFSEKFRTNNHPAIESLVNDALELPAENIVACIRAMKDRNDHIEALKNRSFPLYYFLGDADVRLPLEEMNRELKSLPGAVAHIEEGVGHMGHLECPALVFAFIQRILRADC